MQSTWGILHKSSQHVVTRTHLIEQRLPLLLAGWNYTVDPRAKASRPTLESSVSDPDSIRSVEPDSETGSVSKRAKMANKNRKS
jgi:hypothetical protein